MIERYSLPEMKAIWELQNKYDTWLKVELAVVEAQAELGLIPRGDADRISQVLRNYLTNALKYSSEEKPVRVSVSKDQENARVSVQDEGTGLFPDEQAKIWERFYRVEGSEVLSKAGSANAGLGLGLYICKAIVEQHHGSVGVESTPGVGSTFWFTLPLASSSSIESPS